MRFMTVTTFTSFGNHPALDFLNTTPTIDGAPVERIVTFTALVDFLVEKELIAQDDAAHARRAWPCSETALVRARSSRERLRAIVVEIASGSEPSARSLAKLNSELKDAAGGEYVEVRATESGLTRAHRLRRAGPEDVLAPLARAIAAFLTEAELTNVRKCEDRACTIYFLDTSKNHRRRWCSMELCGNRNKVEAYRERGGRTR